MKAQSNSKNPVLAGLAPVPVAEPGDENMQPVELRLPLNPANPKDNEVTVGLNGRFWKIQRGHTVQVPRAVSEILANSERQTAAAMAYIRSAAQ